MEKVLVTGGAGFIGSHLLLALAGNAYVCVLDNLSSGSLLNIKPLLNSENLVFTKGDLLNPSDLKKLEQDSFDVAFHLAANPEVRVGQVDPTVHFQQNAVATHNLLEYIRRTQESPTLVFPSTSTVYGEATKIPTPEDYSPLEPISIYGASKLACEALITAYAHTYNLKAIIYRLANIVGSRSQHGVVHDFVQKLRKNPKHLEILGDGTQNKSYMYITDCIDAMLLGLEKTKKQVETYNVGSEDRINVKTIAEIAVEEMKLKDVNFEFTGGVDGGRGWKGDVKNMLLDISKIKSLGLKPKYNSAQAIREATKHAITEFQST